MTTLRRELRVLAPMLAIPAVWVILLAVGLGQGSLVMALVGSVMGAGALFRMDRGCGWPTFAVSSGISRDGIVKARFTALSLYSIPVTLIPLAAAFLIGVPSDVLAMCCLAPGIYLAGTGISCWENYTRWEEPVGDLRNILILIVFMVAVIVVSLLLEGALGSPSWSRGLELALSLATGAAVLLLSFRGSMRSFRDRDL